MKTLLMDRLWKLVQLQHLGFSIIYLKTKRELALAASISLMQLRFSIASSATVLPFSLFFFFLRLRLILVKAQLGFQMSVCNSSDRGGGGRTSSLVPCGLLTSASIRCVRTPAVLSLGLAKQLPSNTSGNPQSVCVCVYSRVRKRMLVDFKISSQLLCKYIVWLRGKKKKAGLYWAPVGHVIDTPLCSPSLLLTCLQ